MKQNKMLDITDNESVAQFTQFALELADIGRKNAMKYFRKTLKIDNKPDRSPVTIADREVEMKMRSLIGENYPDHGIFGEEHGQENVVHPQIWVLDPFDGTKSFVTGMPTFGSLISFLVAGQPTIGVLEMPALNERWLGVVGKPTLFNQDPCQTSSCKTLEQAKIYATSIDMFSDAERQIYYQVSSLAAIRRFGGDCYSYGLLASGHIDVVMESTLEPYDYLALVPVVQGAGGVITDWSGKPLDLHSAGNVLASATPELHQQVLDLIAKNGG